MNNPNSPTATSMTDFSKPPPPPLPTQQQLPIIPQAMVEPAASLDWSQFTPPPPPTQHSLTPQAMVQPASSPAEEQQLPPPHPPPSYDSPVTPHLAQASPDEEAYAGHAVDPAEVNNADNADFGIEGAGEKQFPLHCLPVVMRSMAEEVARAHLAPVSLSAACALGTLSAALGGGLELETEGGQSVRGNLFIAAVAPSGVGKGAASNAITEPFRQFERDLVTAWKKDVRPALAARSDVLEQEIRALKKRSTAKKETTSRDDIIKELARLKEEQARVAEQLVPPCLITCDATKEALAYQLSVGKNEALASISSEARGCIDVLCGRYNSMTDESIFVSGWSGDSITIHRKGSASVLLLNPCLSVMWMFQPDKLQMLLGKDAMTSSGLLPRFLIVNTRAQPQEETADRPAISEAVRQGWTGLVTDLATVYHQTDNPSKIYPTSEIKELLRAYKNEIIRRRRFGGDLADVVEYAARWCENAWRLTLVLHAAEHGRNSSGQGLSLTTAQNAITLMKWFAKQQLQILSTGRAEKRLMRLYTLRDLLAEESNRTCTLRDLARRNGFSPDEVRAIADEYPDKLVIESSPPASGPGRPSKVVRLLV